MDFNIAPYLPILPYLLLFGISVYTARMLRFNTAGDQSIYRRPIAKILLSTYLLLGAMATVAIQSTYGMAVLAVAMVLSLMAIPITLRISHAMFRERQVDSITENQKEYQQERIWGNLTITPPLFLI